MHHVPEELIVVLGPGNDNSLEKLKSMNCPFPVKVFRTELRNLCWSRNIGLKASKCEIVAYIDDDAVPEPNWLKNLVSSFADSNVGLVGGWTRFQNSMRYQHQNQVVTETLRVRSLSECEKPGAYEFLSPLGANFALRREVGLELNGFDNFLEWWGDEADLAIRVNRSVHKVVFQPKAIVHHFQADSAFRNSTLSELNVKTPWRSRAYLMAKHSQSTKYLGTVLACDFEIAKQSFEWAKLNSTLKPSEFDRLIQDICDGIREGTVFGIKNRKRAHSGLDDIDGNLAPVHQADANLNKSIYEGLAPIFIYREIPADSAGGITNWIVEMCKAFGEKGVPSVYICQNVLSEETHVSYQEGCWIFKVGINFYYNLEFAQQNFPTDLQTFGILARNLVNVISDGFSISDIVVPSFEGIGNLFLDDERLVTSLHTSTRESLEDHPNLPFDTLTQTRVDMINELEENILKRSSRIIANSNQISRKLGLEDSNRVTVVPHGTKVFDDANSDASRIYESRNPRVSFIGRWEPRKGSYYLPEIISELLNSGMDVRVVGGDPFFNRESSLKAIRKGNLGELTILGILEKGALDKIYAESDVLIIPSVYESFGLVAIEALAAGCGIVAFSGSGIEESVGTCVNAELVSIGEIDEFASRAINLAKRLNGNPSLRNESKCFIASNFSLEIVSHRFLKALKKN